MCTLNSTNSTNKPSQSTIKLGRCVSHCFLQRFSHRDGRSYVAISKSPLGRVVRAVRMLCTLFIPCWNADPNFVALGSSFLFDTRYFG